MSEDCHSKEGESFIALAIIFFIMFIVAAVTFSAYLFIDLTHISNIAGVHVTKNLLMAANSAKGELYNNSEKGITNWRIYTDKNNGFEIKYPSEYTLQKNEDGSEHLVTLKKSNLSPKGSDSLSSAIYVDIKNVGDNTSLKDELKEMGIEWNETWSQRDIGGRLGIRTGDVKDTDGREREVVIWQFGGKIFSLEEYHFNEDSSLDRDLFNKIVSEFKFI
ncbi:MAG: hypothetical protein US63_C0003G0020 [Candidatus Moranbacteria bacterium GW2011_GWC2_37_8]|nr:MAG: hypothetical protein US63_C0003G0020 [Candidatus Moranbacteria bacterium GW2011_GWC2_37_8]KKQ63225.1 MAG: hypothetical protein US82_C0002G0020 [Parcubacteria group bacterium GW2011_GWC1_38_22]